MKIKFYFILTVIIFGNLILNAQNIQNSVISCAGGSSASGNFKLDFTIGEVVSETFQSGNNVLTQGFHQTKLTVTNIDNIDFFIDIYLFPNPTDEFINIEIPSYYNNLEIKFYDANGRLLKNFEQVYGVTKFDLSDFSQGIYYLIISLKENNQTKTFKIIKTK